VFVITVFEFFLLTFDQKSLTLSEFLEYLNKSTVAIVLVDTHILSATTQTTSLWYVIFPLPLL
jgi:hypothetical protein